MVLRSNDDYLSRQRSDVLKLASDGVVLVRGSGLSGKTSLLDTVGRSISEGSVHRISVLDKLESDHFFSLFCESINIKPADTGESRLACEEYMRTHSAFLLIDDLDSANDPDSILRFLQDNRGQFKIVATVTSFKNIDELLLLNTVTHILPPLSLNDVKSYCETLQISEEEKEVAAQNILELSKGHPFLIRLAISQIKIGNRNYVESKNPLDAASILKNVIRIIREKIPSADYKVLEQATLLQYDSRIETSLLREKLSRNSLELAFELTLISQSISQAILNPIAKKLILSEKPNDQSMNELVDWIAAHFDSIESKAEIALLLKRFENKEKLYDYLETVIPELEKSGEYSLICEITDKLPLTSHSVFMTRQRALATKNDFRTSATELKNRLDQDRSEEEKADLIPKFGNCLCRLGRPSDAVSLCESYLKTSESALSLETYVSLSEAYSYFDLNRALDALNKANDIVLSGVKSDIETLTRLKHFEGFIHQRRNSFNKAALCYKEAEELAEKAHDRDRMFYNRMSYYLELYNLGNTKHAISETSKMLRDARKYGLYTVVDACAKTIANHKNRLGSPSKAKDFFPYPFSDIRDKESLNYSDIEYLFASANTLFQEFDYKCYVSILDRMIKHHETMGTQSFWRNWAEQRKNLLQQYLSRGSKIESILEGYMYDPATSEFDQLNLMVFALELNYRFFFYAPKLHKVFENKMKQDIFKHDIDYKVQYLFLYGVHVLMDREFAKAENLLQEAYENAKSFGFFLWEIRALTYLALFDVKRGENRSALTKLNQALKLMEQTDEYEEYHLTRIFHDLIAGESNMQAPPDDSPYSYAFHIANRSREKAIYSPTQDQIRFFDLFFEMALAKSKGSRIQISDSNGRRLINSDQLDALKKQPYDLIVDEVNATLSIGAPGKRTDESIGKHTVVAEMLKLLITNSDEEFTKDELVAHIWKEDYNPLVHDSRVYTTIKRVRELLKPLLNKDPIHTASGKYRIHPQVRACVISRVDESSDLSERQQWILNYVENNGFIVRKTIEKYLKISPTLCKNELKNLVNRGLITTTGKGKSTQYVAGHV